MLVRDIKDDAKQVLGYCDDATIYNRLTDAIEALANKGQWDSMTAYMDIVVQSGNTVVLPREVEIPLTININTHPSFMRTKIYEFSMNGPGNDMAETSSYSWLDKGEIPVLAQPSALANIRIESKPADDGKTITIVGRDANKTEIKEVRTLKSINQNITDNQFSEIIRVVKDVTTQGVALHQADTLAVLANYYPDETEPMYRKIVLTKTAPAIRMLFRRRTYAVTSDMDYIPLQSKIAILMMLKSLEMLRSGSPEQLQMAGLYEQQALKFLKEEQDSRNAFDIASATGMPSTLDISYNNVDSIIVSDIYDDACKIFGLIGRTQIFDYITETIEALANKGHWDGLTGYVDIMTDGYHYITLPRYVETPIALNINGNPKQMRNKWFEFHLNSSGSCCNIHPDMWDDVGDVITLRPLGSVCQFIAQPDLASDDGKIITIYGWDENLKWIRTQVGGVWQDGFQVVMDHTGALPASNAQKVSRIERIIKDTTTGFCSLFAYDAVAATSTTMGYYFPDETEPNYRRIKLPSPGVWVRMRYRKRSLKVSSLTDPIHLKNKLAIIMMMRAINQLVGDQPDMQTAQTFEQKALQCLDEEQSSRNPAETFDIQFGRTTCHNVIL